MASFKIRTATPGDARAIAETHVASWRATYPGIVPQTYIDSLEVEEFAARWLERLNTRSGGFIHVAEEAGMVCGFASGGLARETVEGYAGELYAIYLLPSAQRKGIGAGLVRSIAEALIEADFEQLFVWALEQNPACRFYERLGGSVLQQKSIEIGGASLVEVAYGWADPRSLLPRLLMKHG